MPVPPAIPREAITGLVLAGGRGARMGGADKGLQPWRGMPLARHALRRLAPQVGPLMISANRNLAAYAAFGVPVWPDHPPGGFLSSSPGDPPAFDGPLAGLLAGLAHCDTGWLLAVPCDTPLFPPDLALRLGAAALARGADIAIAAAREPAADPAAPPVLRTQPVFCLLRAALRPDLADFIAGGGRKAGAWTARQRCAIVPFDQPGDTPGAFFNANTVAELRALEAEADRRAAPAHPPAAGYHR